MTGRGLPDRPAAGYTPNGLAFNRFGRGTRPLVVFAGLGLDNAPVRGMASRPLLGPFRCLEDSFDTWFVNRRRRLQAGVTIDALADDYAAWMREAFAGPVDVIGVSTGGSIAQSFALRHPDLLGRLVLWSAACRLGDEGRAFQRRCAELARAGRVRDMVAESLLLLAVPPDRPGVARAVRPLLRGLATVLPKPADVADFVATVEAEDGFDIEGRLGEITAPTLVIGGGRDPYYPPELFRRTAAGIPGARLVLDARAGHVPSTPAIRGSLLAFLGAEPMPHGRAPVATG